METRSPRSYICDRCYMVWDGWFDLNEGRQPCPSCGCREVHAIDSFGAFYWEKAKVEIHGPSFFRDNYWWDPAHLNQERHADARANNWRESTVEAERAKQNSFP